MGQQPRTLTPHVSLRHFLGAELRRWREFRRMSVADLAALTFVSSDLVHKVEKAQRRPSADLIEACDTALNTGGALGRLLAFVTDSERGSTPDVGSAVLQSAGAVYLLIEIIAKTTQADLPTRQHDGRGEARVYPFPGARIRRARL